MRNNMKIIPTVSSSKDQIQSTLQLCSSLRHLESTYTTMIKSNTHQESFSMNQFLAACSRLRHIDLAFAAFHQISHPNIFVYNAILGGFMQCSRPMSALQLFADMPNRTRLRPNGYTFSYLVKASALEGCVEFGEPVHGQIRKMGFGNVVVIQTGLVDFYTSVCKVEETRRVFDEMGNRDVFAWNSMISALARLGCLDEARRAFDEMPEKNVVSWNTMMSGYAKCGDVGSAACLFARMPTKNLFSWTSMISCWLRSNHCNEAIETFERMKAAGITPDQVTMASVIAACAHLGALEVGKNVHHYAMLNGFELDVYLGSALIDMYAKCGSLERSLVVFYKLEKKNLFCWNSMIDGLAIHGRGREAVDMFNRMNKEPKIEPNWVSFVIILNACAHSGLVNEGREMFSNMIEEHSLAPKIEHYCCMVDLLGRAGLLDEALDMIKSMDIEPSTIIWGALLGACKVHGNFRIGKIASEKLLALEPNKSSNYMLMVGMYAQTNKWHEVADLRSAMKENGVKKRSPGCSWIEIDRVVHEFAASDVSHCSVAEICLLNGLDMHLQFTGTYTEWSIWY